MRQGLWALLTNTALALAAGAAVAWIEGGPIRFHGVAAAVKFAISPVWFGAALVLGLPESGLLAHRLWSFAINLTTISGAAVLSYAALHLKAGKPPSAAIIR